MTRLVILFRQHCFTITMTEQKKKCNTFFPFEAQDLQIDMDIITQEGQVQKIVNKENLMDEGKTQITVVSHDQQETGIGKSSSYIVDSNQIFTVVKTEEAITTPERKKCKFFFAEAQKLQVGMDITTGNCQVQRIVNIKNIPEKGKTLICVMSFNQLETDIMKKLSLCIVDLNQTFMVVQTVEDIRE